MLFQYGTLFHIGTLHAGTCFIKGSATYTLPNVFHFGTLYKKQLKTVPSHRV